MTARLDEEVAGGLSRESAAREETPRWPLVAAYEVHDLWTSGRGLLLIFGFSVLLSVVTYLAGSNQALNFLEQRETMSLTLEIAVAVGVLLTLVVSADALSGERERGTLENLLLSPVSRRAIVMGKLVAALSLWLATYVVSVPYVWVLGRGVSVVGTALALGLVVGTLLAVALAALGLLISAVSTSNKVSVAVSLFVLLALFAPSQLPAGTPQGWFGSLLDRLNPVGAATHYITEVLVHGQHWTKDLSYLASPFLIAVLAGGTLVVFGERIVELHGGLRRR
jgi:ABC-2 type transport system permease protein